MPAVVVGRDAELAALDDFVAGISDGLSRARPRGRGGHGEDDALARRPSPTLQSEASSCSQARPAESETALSFSGIGDLLDPVLDEVLESLPAVQRRALSRALVLEDDEGPPPNGHAVGVALLSALRGLAAERLVVVAVDDVQWLDAASTAALAYAVRRLRERAREAFCSRAAPGSRAALLDELSRSLARER